MLKTDHNVSSATLVVLRYGLSIILVSISLSVTLLFQGYTFRTPLFFRSINTRLIPEPGLNTSLIAIITRSPPAPAGPNTEVLSPKRWKSSKNSTLI